MKRAEALISRDGFRLWGLKTEPIERRLSPAARKALAAELKGELEADGYICFQAPEMPNGQNMNCELFGCVRVCDSFDTMRVELRGMAHVWVKDLEKV